MILGLKRALALLKTCGWVGPEQEPMCATSDGGWCFEHDEAVARFSVAGALLATHCYPEGWYALQAVVAPAWGAWEAFVADAGDPSNWAQKHYEQAARLSRLTRGELDLQSWLREPQRTTSEVLRAVVRAIERSKKATGEQR